jgi:splicing factor U2AF subunit
VKVKQERQDVASAKTGTTAAGGENVKMEEKVKEEKKVKAEKKDEDAMDVDGGAKKEAVKGEAVKGEAVKGEGVKSEISKAELEDNSKREKGSKNEVKGEADAFALAMKGEAKSEIKNEMKKERSASRKKKKKDGKIKKEKKDDKKEKKRKRSKSGDAAKKRKSKWGPDTSGFSVTAVSAGRSGLVNLPSIEDNVPHFSEAELSERSVVLENLSLGVTGQELIEFFNGAVLAVTANAVQQAGSKNLAPVYACTITEEDRGRNDKRKSAELKFRTPDGASVGMKLNGIDYKGHKVVVRRPDDYKVPDDGDPSRTINLHEISMARLIGNTGGGADGGSEKVKLSIFNLPEVLNEGIVRDLLSQFGKLRMLSLIRDLTTGKIKGYGIFEYDDSRDSDLAITGLNGFVCGQNVIRVQKLGGAQQANAGIQPKAQPVAATAMANSMTQKIVSNPVLAMQVKQGREVGSRPSTVVQLLNAVYQEDLMDDQDFEDITSEVHQEASKHGTVTQVVIPKPAKDGAYVDGVGKIFVSFSDLTAARKFQMDANGRKFESRVVCAAFYPVDKFQASKFKLWSE